MEVLVSDPSESSLEPITWYAPKLVNSAGAIVHLASRERNQAGLHNSRHALVAGMARGFDLPTLLLAEEGYRAPFDFEQVLSPYHTAAQCLQLTREWLDNLEFDDGRRWVSTQTETRGPLSGIRFGEHVAENESLELAEYFVHTSAYESAVSGDAIYVGHRGTGKTASAMQAFDLVGANRENVAVLIKPPGFEFPALLALLQRLPEYQHDYFFDSLWRFILQTEIAASVFGRLSDRSPSVPFDSNELEFIRYVDGAPFDLRSDISTRLEQVLTHLRHGIDQSSVDDRNLINEALHAKALAELRVRLGLLLNKKRRVAVFVDNVDKGWEKGSDFHVLARLILGLLTARGNVKNDFKREDQRRRRVKLTVAVFLRSDIFNYVRLVAREPDKLLVASITWSDPETLLKVIEARYLSITAPGTGKKALWTKVFPAEVGGASCADYILSVVLPRPRDIVYFCNTAVARALDRGHKRVEPTDVTSAEEQYSQYAYEALLVENGVTIPQMREALLSFLGAQSIQTRGEIKDSIRRESAELADKADDLVEKLVTMSFLGLEVRPGKFEFPEVGSSLDKARALAARTCRVADDQRYLVHRAFHSFLEITS